MHEDSLMIPDAVEQRAGWSRPLAIATAGMFLLSSAFPVIAGLSKDTAFFPRWFGILDVCLAFVLAVLAMAVLGVACRPGLPRSERLRRRAARTLMKGQAMSHDDSPGAILWPRQTQRGCGHTAKRMRTYSTPGPAPLGYPFRHSRKCRSRGKRFLREPGTRTS